MKKRLLFIIPSLEGGGSEKVLSVLLRYLSNSRFEIFLALVCKQGVYYDNLPPHVNIINLKALRNRYALLKIFKTIKQTSPDVVVTFNVNNIYIYVAIASLFLPSKIRYVTRESTTLSFFIKRYSYFRFLVFAIYKLLYNISDIVICQSVKMKEDMVENFNVDAKRAIIINNPIETNLIQTQAISTLEGGLMQNNTYKLLAIGRYVSAKGFDLLIKAIANIAHFNLHLVILGDETAEEPLYKKKLYEIASECNVLDKISFLPFDINPYRYLSRMDALVLSSRYEGFPNVAIEAHAVGKPVVAYKSLAGIQDIIMDGVNGVLVNEDTIVALASGIEKAHAMTWNKESVIETAKRYDCENIIPLYEKIFHNV
jgi:glycosyltransferase involved in cell wall biosynthesis